MFICSFSDWMWWHKDLLSWSTPAFFITLWEVSETFTKGLLWNQSAKPRRDTKFMDPAFVRPPKSEPIFQSWLAGKSRFFKCCHELTLPWLLNKQLRDTSTSPIPRGRQYIGEERRETNLSNTYRNYPWNDPPLSSELSVSSKHTRIWAYHERGEC